MEVMILAGGLGTRLRSVVSDIPKCMAPVAGKPFLWYLLEYLRRFDVSAVILSVGYLREAIESWIAEHAQEYPFEFRFAVETEPLGTGGAIKLAASQVRGSEVVIINGDTYFDVDLNALEASRRSTGASITIALKKMYDFDRYGSVEIAPDGTIVAFREKVHRSEGLINGGVSILDLSSDLLAGTPEKFSFEKEVMEPQCRLGKLYGLEQKGYFIDIGIPEDYARANANPDELLA